MRFVRWRAAMLAVVLLTLSACAFPRDPDGTLDRIQTSGTLRAGASHHPPFVVQDDPPTGTEVDLIERYAEHLGAEVEWTVSTEGTLVEAMENGELDVIVAGLDDSSPWADKVGLTSAYAELPDDGGPPKPRVMAVPMGENALLVDLERWLAENAPTS